MTAEAKLRTLAAANAALQALFGAPPAQFRWQDTQLIQGTVYPSVVVWRVSTIWDSRMDTGISKFTQVRLQLDIRHPDPEQARAAASAVIAFLNTVNLSVVGGSVTSRQAPCFILNQRTALDYNITPPVSVATLDIRAWNFEE